LSIGLSFHEELTGGFALNDDPMRVRAITLEYDARLSLRPTVMTGNISLEGIAGSTSVVGEMRASLGARAVHYEVAFDDADGRAWGLHMTRRLHLRNLYASLTVIRGELRAGRKPAGWVVMRFNARDDLFRFVRGLRWTGAL
jgi:hypothetical protein